MEMGKNHWFVCQTHIHTTDLCLHAVNKLVNEGQSDP